MADFLTPEQRSHRMSLIRSSGTKPERMLASLLRRNRIRFRGQAKLPGTPDFVLLDSPVAVFANGDFWHGRNLGQLRRKLSSFWRDKITTNVARDRRVDKALRRMGYKVVRIWESDLYKNPQKCLGKILKAHLTISEGTISCEPSALMVKAIPRTGHGSKHGGKYHVEKNGQALK